jgi:hypothetical protein
MIGEQIVSLDFAMEEVDIIHSFPGTNKIYSLGQNDFNWKARAWYH